MIKRYKKQARKGTYYRVNDRIFAPQVRVLDFNGKQIGVLSRFDALEKARGEQLDLVEIAPNAKPPVVKIIDFKKFLYQEEKKKKEERKKSKQSETKEVRLGPFMDDHDLNVMIKRAREFLEDGNKVRFVMRFMGRQITHPEFGREVMQKAIQAVSEISKLEREAHFEGKQLVSLLVAERKSNAKDKDQESSIEQV